MTFARVGCRWVTATAHSTTPTLTNNRIIVNHRANGLRTAIPFGRKALAVTRKCGQRRMRQAVTREGGYTKRNPRLARERAIGDPRFRHPIHWRDGDSVWPANVRLLRQCDVIGKGKRFRYGVVLPNGMEVRCPVAFAWGEKCQAGHIAHEESGVRHIHKAKIYYESLCVNLHRG